MKTTQDLFASCEATLRAKETDYGILGQTTKEIAQYLGLSPATVNMVFLMKHINVIKRMGAYPDKFTSIDLEHRMKDAINFIVLLGIELEDFVIPMEEDDVSSHELL